jgi:hypothetical protein
MTVQAPTSQFQDGAAGEPGVLDLYCQYTSGATGAIPATLTRSQGFQSVARTGTGVVDFILNAPAFKLLDYSIHVDPASYAFTTGGSGVSTLVDAVATATSSTSCKVTVTFRRGDTGAAADTANGDLVRLTLRLKTVSLNG